MLTKIKKVIGDNQANRRLKTYYKIVEQINSLEQTMEQLTDEQLREKTVQFKQQITDGASIFDIQAEAFAVVREASKRVHGMRHFDVQLIGGLVLAEGNIAEMPTGEGKTLVASLPSYLRALEGKGVHVITVNEYLARRDRDQIGQIHEFLGLTVGLNVPQMDPREKVAAYDADITYGVGTEFGFDHLRDNLVYDLKQRVQRPYHFAIVDEVDSVLIDEAKTPLIIASKTGVNRELSKLCAKVVRSFKQDVDYQYDPETKATSFTDEGINKIERGFGIDNLYELEHQSLYHYMIQALRAKVMFKKDVDYIIKEDKVLLVDMFTGRPMEGRSLSGGLHQAIEAKEGVEITEENKTTASVTIQNYFRLYPSLSGMTGTAKTEEKEFQELYGMDVIQIPTNKPVIREDVQDKIFMTIDQKYKAVAQEVKKVHATGQPILVGTTSILQSEAVAEYLQEEGLEFELLNAKSIDNEVRLISLAGQKGHITIATNMAGRGTDIRLGEGVEELGGLYVIGTERHESRRIDNQLKGRSGRQGDPGRTRFFISLEDEMFKRFAREELEKLMKKVTADEHGQVTDKLAYEFVERTQRICEGANYSVREYNLKLDNIMDDQRTTIYSLRNKILSSNDLTAILIPMMKDHIEHIVRDHCLEELTPDEWNIDSMDSKLLAAFPQSVLDGEQIFTSRIEDIQDVQSVVQPLVDKYVALIEEKREDDKTLFEMRQMLISTVDQYWLDHIDAMERLKEGVGLRSYSGEDPMRQYQREGLELFTKAYENIEEMVTKRARGLF